MQKIISKISSLYIGKVIAIHFFAFLAIAVCAKYLPNIYNTEKRIFAVIIIIVVLGFLFTIWKEVVTLKKIIVDSESIKIYNAFSTNEIKFLEIERIQTHKFKMALKAVSITDGYTYSEIVLKNNIRLIISPEKFENYSEIMEAINKEIGKHFE